MNKLVNGIVAGLIATAVLSVLMVMKGLMGLMPDVNVVAMLAKQMGTGASIGWAAHVMIGVGYGIFYAVVFGDVNVGSPLVRGIALGMIGWLVMMVILMPVMDAGLFGLQMPSGMLVPVATLMLHVIFGAVLGLVYAKISR